MSENYSLIWQAFTGHLQLMLRELYESEKFSDLTLICDDQTEFRVHQSVLSVSSPVLGRIIDNCPAQHPLIYLRGIQSEEIQSILQFIYLGEAKVSPQRIEEFIRVAKDLRVKEIKDNLDVIEEENKDFPDDPSYFTENFIDDEKKENVDNKKEIYDLIDDKESPVIQYNNKATENENIQEPFPSIKTGDGANKSVCQTNEDLNFEFKTIPCTFSAGCNYRARTKKQLDKHVETIHEKKLQCSECGQRFVRRSVLLNHVEAKHEGIRYPCDQCSYQSVSVTLLKRHSKIVHEGLRYHCDQCEYTSSRQQCLKQHIQSKHEGIRYPCDKCEYEAADPRTLKTHVRMIHDKVKYPCDQCEYQAISKTRLNSHIKIKHEGVRLSCDQCDHQFMTRDSLRIHIKSKHQGIKVPCPQCPAEFRSAGDKTRHLRTVHGFIIHHCNQCDYQTERREALKIHVKKVHDGVLYYCDQCEYVAKQKSSLTFHIRSRHEGIKHACDQCEYQTLYPGSLKAHIEGIHKNMMMKCQLCDFQTKWKPELYNHRKTHSTETE